VLCGFLQSCTTMPAESRCGIADVDLARGRYHGECLNGLAEGYAVVEGESSYAGDFVAGKKHGAGIKTMSNGDQYSGHFSQDYRQGYGRYVWGENSVWAGNRYSGEYQHDLRQGFGVFEWRNGDRYEGGWHADLRLGQSVMEQRRADTRAARLTFKLLGQEVCFKRALDVCGRLESATNLRWQIRLTQLSTSTISELGAAQKIADLIEDIAENWQPKNGLPP
jgi:hypothetical protein